MTTGRRQNRLTNVDKVSEAKQQLSYGELLHSFILDCKSKNLSPLTIRFYQDSVKQMEVAFRDQEIELDIYSLTSRDIKNHFVAYLFDRGRSDNTVNGRIKAVKQFLRYLFEEGWLLQNISDELHATKSEKLMIQTFTKEQVVALLEKPDRDTFSGYRDYTMMLILLETGIWISELCNLKIGDVFFKEQEIRITRGKGGKARRVPIQQTCAKVIRRYLDIRGDLETDALFVNINNEKISTAHYRRKCMITVLHRTLMGSAYPLIPSGIRWQSSIF